MKLGILLIAGGVSCLCVPLAGAASTAISSCQEITRSGSYVLTLDLADSTGQSCLRIHDVSNVSLDCGGHSIVTTGNAAVSLDNVKNYSVQRCSLQTQWTAALSITNSSGGQVSTNTFGDPGPAQYAIPAVSLVHISGLNFSANQVYGAYQQYNGSGATVSGNNFLSTLNGSGNQGAAMVLLQNGSGNFIYRNTIDGNARFYVNQRASGFDDGILLGDESNDTIATNTIRNNWDCGIEFLGSIKSVLVRSNTIRNSGYVGFGGFYFFSLSNSTFSGNTVDHATAMFRFSRIYGLRPANYQGTGTPAETGVYFQNNYFQSNSFLNPQTPSPVGASGSVDLAPDLQSNPPLLGLDYWQGNAGDGLVDPTPAQFHLSNNVFLNNNFGYTLPAPAFGVDWTGMDPVYPSGNIIDGGGNICVAPTNRNYPLNCR